MILRFLLVALIFSIVAVQKMTMMPVRNERSAIENLTQDLVSMASDESSNQRLSLNVPKQDFDSLTNFSLPMKPSMQDFGSLLDDKTQNISEPANSDKVAKKRFVRSPLTQAERELDKLADAQGPPLMRTQRPIFAILQDIIRTFQGGVKKFLGRARSRAGTSDVDDYEKYKNCRLNLL